MTGNLDWMERGACKDAGPKMFFPKDNLESSVSPAKQICEICEVRLECLEYALENRVDHGLWGGYSEEDRRKILRQGISHSVVVQAIRTSSE